MTTGRPSVVVLDYGSGNVHSAVKALEAAGADVALTDDRVAASEADGLVVPGVGAFANVMRALDEHRVGEIVGRRLAGGRPVLGICVGLQVMFEAGLEGGAVVPGLGEWPGEVRRLEADVLPHMGWDTVDAPEGSVLFDGIRDERFYFVHSYAAPRLDLQPHPRARPVHVTTCTYGETFVAAVENGPLSATQFHPEKSGAAGIRLLSNWIGSLRGDG
ncbi:imidazole glycerol phosphate synthase subunit HisH [Pseudoclavibacter chungangensis]|uniref:Imidazole glycerol phosphate synthase subunit HisH n=1 Tax=Pseudoclavibacter chungangensis TaxID=587635 RepID=A0A7J5BQA2_9MICO|nr:imidazole glycerol phosphate synthase subunit HisH [Pseudoclavibacter chungangensis]KAB1653111.1 imidazole glycerol phosphate synthase subunit HisH [Pseudoclavibacter chungangensis]NYJ67001.1 glutamine amidotransferase [Pseudoclavibacter chungangensis]